MKFAEYLNKLIDTQKMSVNELADSAGVNAGHLSRVLAGKRPTPGPKTLKKIAIALGADYEQLLEEAGYLDLKLGKKLSVETKQPKSLELFMLHNEVVFRQVLLSEGQKKLFLRIIQAVVCNDDK